MLYFLYIKEENYKPMIFIRWNRSVANGKWYTKIVNKMQIIKIYITTIFKMTTEFQCNAGIKTL